MIRFLIVLSSLYFFPARDSYAAPARSMELANLNQPIILRLDDLAASLTPGIKFQVFLNYAAADWITPQIDPTGGRIVVRLLGDPNDPNAAAHARQVRRMLENPAAGDMLAVCVKGATATCTDVVVSVKPVNRWDPLWIALLLASLALPWLVPRLLRTRVRDSDGRRTALERVSLTATVFYVWNFAVLVSIAFLRARTGEWIINRNAVALLGLGSAIRAGAKFIPGSRLGAILTQPIFASAPAAPGGVAPAIATDPKQPGPASQPPAALPPTSDTGPSPNIPAVFQPILRIFSQTLTDADGLALHRIQFAAWTVILLAWYLRAVYLDWALPDFDVSLIGVSAVSGAFHLMSKPGEQISRSNLTSTRRPTHDFRPRSTNIPSQPHSGLLARIGDAVLRFFSRDRATKRTGD